MNKTKTTKKEQLSLKCYLVQLKRISVQPQVGARERELTAVAFSYHRQQRHTSSRFILVHEHEPPALQVLHVSAVGPREWKRALAKVRIAAAATAATTVVGVAAA